ncbi:hypothetical protein DM01DRAFT_1405306 [Hesseltinella vesiculosa]|uniref:Uncharacterized protein n=1 Tax=Hesseltinella vesiculosa TaxID=101127 RepID=A0A1X2GRY5_9FUNG|nr:hypothetical protein DM01DRAFT_1405306 [Hesseltinella vesiculosa]
MIIAKPLKKPICIPLQTFPPTNPSLVEKAPPSPPATDLITHGRLGQDFVAKLFGDTKVDKCVEQVMTIRLPISDAPAPFRQLESHAFIFNDTVFMSSPVVVGEENECCAQDFQSSVTRFIELAEEKTGCSALVVAIDKQKHEVNAILRAYMYLGFQLVNPSIYQQHPQFTLVGYEL